MITTLHIALNNCPEYIIKEAEIILTRLMELTPYSDALRMKLSRNSKFYQADIQTLYSGRHLIVSSKSRYLNDALEDSTMKIFGLLDAFNGNRNGAGRQ